jgi:CheY-like chemotaxis protein
MARILVIEDEPNARRVTTAILLQAEHGVIETNTGQNALSLLEDDPTYDMVITDLHVPQIENVYAAEYLKQAYPHLRVVVVSSDMRLPKKAQQIGADNYLQKPFRPQQLIEVVEATLHK